jgi:hypothetical protein
MQIENIPTWFSDYWGISLEAAQAILSIAVILAVVLPIMLLSKGEKSTFITSVLLFLVEALLVGIGWLPFWILIATVAVMAVAIAMLGTRVVTGA